MTLTLETKVPMQEEASSGAEEPAAMKVAPGVDGECYMEYRYGFWRGSSLAEEAGWK